MPLWNLMSVDDRVQGPFSFLNMHLESGDLDKLLKELFWNEVSEIVPLVFVKRAVMFLLDYVTFKSDAPILWNVQSGSNVRQGWGRLPYQFYLKELLDSAVGHLAAASIIKL